MSVGGVGGTHYDAAITHVELRFWVDGCGWGRVLLIMTLLSHMLS